ncbi:MAG TPA: Crp/Fnr family transcriptional regulator [Acidobacteriaceae bacterium]|nr:Crp/Fnr family transcriptional regulator [Acidobacteriaceae bacterium]
MATRTHLSSNPLNTLRGFDIHAIPQNYLNRQTIFVQGEKADAMFYIRSGHVKLSVSSKSGKKAVIAVLRRGDFFGEGCLARRSLRTSTATAIQPSTIARVTKAAMVRLIDDNSAFARVFIAYLLTRIGRIEDKFVDQIFSSSEKRLARTLLLLAGSGMRRDAAMVNVTQETLAEMVGTTRSRVSCFMNRFRKLGYIGYNGGLHVHRTLLSFLLSQ